MAKSMTDEYLALRAKRFTKGDDEEEKKAKEKILYSAESFQKAPSSGGSKSSGSTKSTTSSSKSSGTKGSNDMTNEYLALRESRLRRGNTQSADRTTPTTLVGSPVQETFRNLSGMINSNLASRNATPSAQEEEEDESWWERLKDTVTDWFDGDEEENTTFSGGRTSAGGGRRQDASWWDVTKNTAATGLSQFNKGLAATVDFVLPTELLGEKWDFGSKLNDYYSGEYDRYSRKQEEMLADKGKAAQIASDLGVGTVAAIPNALLALMSGGSSLAGQGTTAGLQATSAAAQSSGILGAASTAMQEMAKNPLYWSSFAQTVGTDYEEAKENGASELEAVGTAFISSLLNAGVEIGGGLETLPASLRSGNKSAIGQWVKSALEEGREELVQGVISGLTQKALYDQDKAWYSSTDEEAVINPGRMAEEFALGTAVGGILGGGQTLGVSALNAGINAENNRRASNLGSQYRGGEQELIETGLSFPEGTEAHETAKAVQEKMESGQTVTDADLGRVVYANEQAIRQEERNAPVEETLLEAAREATATPETTRTAVESSEVENAVQRAEIREETAKSPYNVLNVSQMKQKAAQNDPKYGQTGTQAYTELVNEGTQSAEEVRQRFQSAYEAGLTNLPRAKANLIDDVQEIAYNAGRQDAILSMKKAEVKGATVWGKAGGLIENDYSAKLDARTHDTLQSIGKATGTKIIIQETVAEGRANGAYQDGVIRVAADAENPVMVVLKHELTHRLQEMAPKEYRAFRDYAVQTVSTWDIHGSSTATQRQQEAYRKGGVNIGTEEAMDEIAANFTEKILTDEQALNDFVNHVTQSKDQGTRTMGQKFFQAVREFIDKVKRIFRGDKARMDKAARTEFGATISQLERAEQLWKDAYRAAEKRVETQGEQAYNGRENMGVKNSLKEAAENGEAREENRQAFLERGNRKGLTVFEGQTAAYGYKAVSGGSVQETARLIQEELTALGVDCAVVEGVIEWNRKGVTRQRANDEAVTVEGKIVLVSNNVDVPAREAAGHEAFHFWKSRSARQSYIEVLEDNILYTNKNFLDYQGKIADAYFGGEVDLADAQALAGLREELFAYISGHIHDGIYDADLRPMFRDFDAVKAAWGELVQGQAPAFNDSEVKYSLVTDKETLDFLNGQKGVKVYRAMQEIDGKLYPPMAALVKGESGKKQLVESTKKGAWYQADERPDLIKLDKNGRPKFELNKGNGGMVPAAYNPYFHTSASPLNDQFSSAFDRPNIVVVEGYIPESELTSGYKAKYAKDSVGETSWHAGPVASKLKGAKARRVFLSRWFKAERVVPNEEVAKIIAKTLEGEDVRVPWNVVTPGLREALEAEGVDIDYKDVKMGSKVVSFKSTQDTKYSLKDSEGNTLTKAQEEYFKDSKVRDRKGNLLAVYHTSMNEFTEFDKSRKGEATGGTNTYLGFFFADTPDHMENFPEFEGGQTKAYYLNMTKPLDMTDTTKQMFLDVVEVMGGDVDEAAEVYDAEMEASRQRARNRGDNNTALMLSNLIEEMTGEYDFVDFFEELQPHYDELLAKGYDGVINFLDEMTGVKEYVVPDSNQAKLTSNQKPTSGADIRYSLKDGEGNTSPVEESGKIESKAFVQWFGDWRKGDGSKVVDADGKPLVVYHGTGTTIEEFKPEFTGQGNDQYGSGFYFTTSRETAEHYTGATLNGQPKLGGSDNPNVIPVFLNIRNPIVVNARETPNLYNFDVSTAKAARIIEKMPNIMDEEESILGDFIDEYWEAGPKKHMIQELARMYDWTLGTLETDIFRDFPTEFREAVNKVLGYDGVQVNFEDGTKHYVAWFPNQIKHATENSGAFSAEDNRIKFSLKGTNDLMQENAKLKAVNQELREQFKRTKFAKVDRKSLDAFTKKLLKDYSSGADINEIRGELDELYTYMANGRDGDVPVWEETYRMAYDVAQNILENASVLNDELYQQYKGLRSYLRTTGLSLDKQYEHDLGGYENLAEFRKAHFGSIKLRNDGLPVNIAYEELARMYPEFFNAEEYTHPADQLVHIAQVLDELQPYEENPYSQEMSEASTWLANDILERFFELPQAKPTFADKAERRLTEQKIKDARKLEQLRTEKNEQIAKIIEEQRTKLKKAVDGQRMAAGREIEKLKRQYKERDAKKSESQKAREMRAKILRHTTELSKKLIRASDRNHIPQELQGTVAKLLECINLESNYTYDPQSDGYKKSDKGLPTTRTRMAQALQKMYAEMADQLTVDPDLLGPDGLLSDVIGMADLRLVDMTLTELNTVWNALRAIEATIQNANIAFNQSRHETIVEWAEELYKDNHGKKERTELRGMLGKGQQLTGLDMMTPEAYFHRLGAAGDGLFRMLRDAQDDHIRMMKDVADFTHEALKGVNVKKLESTVHTVKLGGQDVKLTTAQIMELYALLRREQAREHILVGGILPDVVSAKGIKKIAKAKPVRGVQPSELFKAFDLLTEEQKKVAETLQEYASTQLSEWGNKAAMKVYNYTKFNEKVYWPIRVNRQEVQSNVQKDTQVTSIANKGMSKATKPHASNSVRVGSIFDTFATHSSEMATYAAWLSTMEDINRIRNYSYKAAGQTVDTVKAIIDTVHGRQGSQYLDKLLADLSNGVKGTHGETDYMSGIVGNYKAAAVGANLRVIIQQPTAILRAMDMIGPQYMVAGLRPANGWKKAKQYAPIAQWKSWGYFDINTGRQMKDVLFNTDSAIDKVKSAGMWGAGAMDSLSWGMLWNAVETETKHKRKDLQPKSEEFYQAVAERFNEIIDHTQVVDGILQRSQIMRSTNGLTKMATAFMGEPTKQYNMFMSSVYDATHGSKEHRKAGRKHLARATVVLAISGVANAMAQAVMDAVRDDDKEKDYWEKWLTALTGLTGEEETAKDKAKAAILEGNLGSTFNPAGYIPYVKDILSLIQGYDVARMDMDSISNVITAGQNFVKALNGEGRYSLGGASANFFAEAAKLLGIPVANLKREVKTFAMTAAVETDNYLMQYRMEKAALSMNYSSNKNTFMDIMYNAYKNDWDAYEIIREDLLESGFTEEDLDAAIEKRKLNAEVSEAGFDTKAEYFDELFRLLQNDDLDGYMELAEDLNSSGVVDMSDIRTAMRSRATEAGLEFDDFNSAMAAAGIKLDYDIVKEEEDKYTIDDLSSSERKVYMESYGDMVEDIIDDFQRRGFGSLDKETANSLLNAAYSFAADTALEEASGGSFESDTKWINAAQESDELGLSVAEFIMLKEEYSSSALTAEGVYEAYEHGVPVEVYLEARDGMKDIVADRDANGNSISGSKKAKIIDYLNSLGLTYEQYLYLLGTEYATTRKDPDYIAIFGKE